MAAKKSKSAFAFFAFVGATDSVFDRSNSLRVFVFGSNTPDTAYGTLIVAVARGNLTSRADERTQQ
jgi:hypothetical protein